jgi:hypothetical protein
MEEAMSEDTGWREGYVGAQAIQWERCCLAAGRTDKMDCLGIGR